MTATKHRPASSARPPPTLRLDAGRGRSTSASTSTRPPTTSPSSPTGAGLVATWTQPAGPDLLVERLKPIRDAGRPGRLRGRAHRLRPGPPPPGRRATRPRSSPRRSSPPCRARRPRATASTAAGWPSSPRRGCCTPVRVPDRAGGGRPPGAAAPRAAGPQAPRRSSSRSRRSSCSTASPSRPGWPTGRTRPSTRCGGWSSARSCGSAWT